MPRKLRQIEHAEFGADDLTHVVSWMARLASAGDGWINFVPQITDDDPQPTALRFFTLLSGGGPGVTMCTWVPGTHDQRGRNQPSLGIAHVSGRRVVAILPLLNVPLPETWLVEQDHPRRGLVLRIPAGESHEQVLAWALRAVSALSTPQIVRGWRADIYLPTRS